MRRFAIAPISGILLAALTSTIAASGVDGSYNCSSTSACFSASQTAPAGSSGAGFHGSAVNSAGMRGSSTNSVGLLGQSASGTFLEPGVEGETTVAATGGNLTVGGGFGLSLLTGGQGPSIGVVGTGTSYGVEGENASNSGSESPGVVGIDKTGETAGTVGESNATASTTGGIGVAGFLGTPGGSADVVGTAVFGEAGSAGAKNMNSGIAYGGYFVSDQSSDETVGIAAESTSDAAVFGNMTNSSELDIATGSDLLNGTGSTGGASFYVDQSANIYTSGSVTAKGTETSGDATYRQAGASGSTLTAYGMRLAAADPSRGQGLVWVTLLVERWSYGGIEPSADQIATALAVTRDFRGGRSSPPDGPRPAGRRGHPRESASASSNEAPAASRGR